MNTTHYIVEGRGPDEERMAPLTLDELGSVVQALNADDELRFANVASAQKFKMFCDLLTQGKLELEICMRKPGHML